MPVIDRKAFLSAVLNTLPDAISVFDADMNLLEINPAGLRMSGAASKDELIERSLVKQILKHDRQAFFEKFEATLRGEDLSSRALRIEVECHKGAHRVLECRMALLDSIDGEAPGVVITACEIGEREDRERLLANDESLLRSILDTVPDALIVIGKDGVIQSFSKTAEAMFGYREAELLGRNVSMLMPMPHRGAHDGYIKRYMQTGEKRIIGIGRIVEAVRSDGTAFPIELSIGEAQAGNHLAFTGFVRDISKRIAAETELNKVQAALVHASRVTAVGSLASALAHELNQPLTAIANYVSAGRDMVASEAPDSREMIREAFEEAAKDAHRAGEIVNRMRSFMTNGEVEMRNLTLGKLINDATTLGLVGAKEKGVEWWIDIEPDIGDVVADQVQIQQVMVNLMRNAIEAMEHSAIKHLIIRARGHGEKQVEISIIDSGPGISPDVQKILFQPFTSTKLHGMGLGLSICRTIIEGHGGRLSMETGDDGGAIFRFTLMRASREFDNAN